jgi:hypothetical protein
MICIQPPIEPREQTTRKGPFHGAQQFPCNAHAQRRLAPSVPMDPRDSLRSHNLAQAPLESGVLCRG